MRRRIGLAAAMVVMMAGPATRAGAEEPGRLRVLYAGHPGSERERDYVGFLRGTFGRVDAVDYREFREEMAEGHDVVLFDWTSIFKRDAEGRKIDLETDAGGMNYPATIPRLSERYARPTVLIGGPGQKVVDRLRLKIDWGCLCLENHAHGTRAGHPIFREPFPIDLPLEDLATPQAYRAGEGGPPLGPTLRGWRVQTPKVHDADLGVVSNGDEFEEAPDAEAISSGINFKGPRMVALGRQASFFLWGFSAPPSEMTPEGRKCFLNAVCYIRQFDGRKPLVRKAEEGIATREQMRRTARFAPIALDPDGFRRAFSHFALYPEAKYRAIREVELGRIRKTFPAEVNDRGTADPGAYLAWLAANDRWLIPGVFDPSDASRTIRVDEDLKALGLDNREVATLDVCAGLLAQGDPTGRPLRILRRYSGLDFADAAGWKAWLDATRDRLVFTEVGGFRFVVADSAGDARPEAAERVALEPEGPPKPRFDPVRVSGTVEPARGSIGQEVTVTLALEIADRWHVAARAGKAGPEVPVYLRLALPEGLEPVGDWALPQAIFDAEGHGRHEGRAEFRRRVRVTAAAVPGLARVTPSANYQACDAGTCRPPLLKAVPLAFEVVAP